MTREGCWGEVLTRADTNEKCQKCGHFAANSNPLLHRGNQLPSIVMIVKKQKVSAYQNVRATEVAVRR